MFRTIFRLKERLVHSRLNDFSRELMDHDGITARELHDYADEKLQRLLRYAVLHVPYYRALAAEEGLHAPFRISDFPILAKRDIRGHESDFISDECDVDKLQKTRTSGSTGEPFVFYRMADEWDASYAVLWRGLKRFGINPGDKRVLVKGVDESAHVSVQTRIKRFCYGVINRCIVIDAHFLAKSEKNILKELERVLAYKPVFFHGYVSSIYMLARTAEEHGVDLAALKVKAVVTESEKCHDFQRELMERVFRAPVVENYGCVEFGMIAQPAKDGTPCINEDHVYVETTPDGEAVYTNLDGFAFPLIRFKNGDLIKIGSPHRCLPYRTIESISGRIAENIYLPQGGSLQGYIVMYPISKQMQHLKQYQVFQPDIDHLVIRVVPNATELPKDIGGQILREMREIVGDKIQLAIENVENIPLTKRGKRAFVVSEVAK